MDIKLCISNRIRELREAQELTQEKLAHDANSDPATLSKIESGKRNITIKTLADIIAALKTTPKDFFSSDAFAAIPLSPTDTIQSEFLSFEQTETGLRLLFPCGSHEAHFDFDGLEAQTVESAVLQLRSGLQQKHEGHMSDAISSSFLLIVRKHKNFNPSDVWRYIIYRAFLDPKNHPPEDAEKDFNQSFKRTSGWALERIIHSHYSPYLQKYDVFIDNLNAKRYLTLMGVENEVNEDKVDMFIYGMHEKNVVPIGIIHVKASIAERRTDDVPASQRIIKAGFISLFVTMDTKDKPSSTPFNKGEYGQPLENKGKSSNKRRDIEIEGYFSGVFSFNANTIESPVKTNSGSRIVNIDFSDPNDAFTQFILARWVAITKDLEQEPETTNLSPHSKSD